MRGLAPLSLSRQSRAYPARCELDLMVDFMNWPLSRLAICRFSVVLALLMPAFPGASAQTNAFQREWTKFQEGDKSHPPPSGAILAIGSSSLRLWSTLQRDLAPLPMVNRAFGGSKTRDTVEAVPHLVIPYRPRVILYYCGDNDLSKPEVDPAVAVHGFKAFVAAVRQELPQVRIVYLSIKPSPSRILSWPNARKANAEIRDWSARQWGITFVDVGSPLLGADGEPDPKFFGKDRLHLSALGYEEWAKKVKPVLRRVWREANARSIGLGKGRNGPFR